MSEAPMGESMWVRMLSSGFGHKHPASDGSQRYRECRY
jgi:hypothetical protein